MLSLGLLMTSLLTLHAGRFVQIDDTSGFGSERWVMPLGLVAGLLALGAVTVGLLDRTARRALGGALAGIDLVLVALSVVDDGFRFIWGAREGELLDLQVVLGLAALVLLIPRFLTTPGEAPAAGPRTGRRLTGWARVALSLAVLVLVLGMVLAFVAGTTHTESSLCGGRSFGGDCDELAAFEGLLWAGGVFVVGVIVVVVSEVSRFRKRRAGRPGDRAVA